MPSAHSSLTYHVIFSTKNREPWLESVWRQRLFDYFGGCFRTDGGVLLEAGGARDHVHLLVGLKPAHRVCDVVRDVKRATHDWIAAEMGLRAFAWQEGYGCFSVNGYRCSHLVRYIRDQDEHHRTRTFQEEYRAFLEEHGIEYDERYLW